MNHTLEVIINQNETPALRAFRWVNWYDPAYAEMADQHLRIAVKNGVVHVVVIGGEISESFAKDLIRKFAAGETTLIDLSRERYFTRNRGSRP